MDDLEILNSLFKENSLIQKDDEYGKSCVTLTEPQAPDSSAKIRNLPHDAFIIKVDAFKSPDSIFQGRNGECKRADYVIISPEKKCIIYIEVKRTSDKWEQIVHQLQGAACFMKYCQEIGKAFWQTDQFLTGYKHRFVSIGRTSIAKTKTKVEKSNATHDTPKTALKIMSPNHLQFNQLAGS